MNRPVPRAACAEAFTIWSVIASRLVGGLGCAFGCALGCALAACSPGGPGPGLDTARELSHVAGLTALGPRPTGSAAAAGAVALIEHELAGIPLEVMPVGDVELPAIEVLGTTFR
ncbi:MAG: hypothetical protein ABI467_31945, partial [Kofleriaceae bacterium]